MYKTGDATGIDMFGESDFKLGVLAYYVATGDVAESEIKHIENYFGKGVFLKKIDEIRTYQYLDK
jgi:hypothetical protein